ncbi:unnamed protein product [Ascophyllum nodosum]
MVFEEENATQLEDFRLSKLGKWKAMIQSGELEEVTRMALEMDVVDQEEALEVGNRRTSRKKRKKDSHQDFSELDSYFEKKTDWRDVAGANTSPAAESSASSSLRGQLAGLEEGKRVQNGDDLATELVAGLGLEVVGRAGSGRDRGRDEEDEMLGELEGIPLGGVGESDVGARELKRAIRKEEKGGKDAEKVAAMMISAAERDGIRDDELFSFALKSLARMGRLDLALRVNEMRQRYLDDDDLENHDRGTTAGLAVACLRAGDEASALEVFQSAVKPLPTLESSDSADEDWAMVEAEASAKEILKAEGEVLPELLSHYLDRLQKERSKEAATGLRKTMDRALRQGEFAIAAVEERRTFPSSVTPPTEPRPLFVGAYNQLIRRLGKADRLADVFEVLDRITTLGVESDQETLEFVTNASVKDVEFETRAVSMKSLPSGKAALPEVVFVGRSNVGKSSLVNMLVNRKALAPTSAVPGFTQHFNYYAVNKGRRKSPSFFLVDVPGLGYARADDGRVDSWKSTLQRYLRVRESLRVVFHLVDVRTGLQNADMQLMSLMNQENQGRSSYVMVLTKCDKASEAKRALVTDEVRRALEESGFPASSPVIATSAKSKEGRVELWSYLRLMFDVDRRRKGEVQGPGVAEATPPASDKPLITSD